MGMIGKITNAVTAAADYSHVMVKWIVSMAVWPLKFVLTWIFGFALVIKSINDSLMGMISAAFDQVNEVIWMAESGYATASSGVSGWQVETVGFLEKANYIFPVSETFLMLSLLAQVYAVALVYRLVKSWLPVVGN